MNDFLSQIRKQNTVLIVTFSSASKNESNRLAIYSNRLFLRKSIKEKHVPSAIQFVNRRKAS